MSDDKPERDVSKTFGVYRPPETGMEAMLEAGMRAEHEAQRALYARLAEMERRIEYLEDRVLAKERYG